MGVTELRNGQTPPTMHPNFWARRAAPSLLRTVRRREFWWVRVRIDRPSHDRWMVSGLPSAAMALAQPEVLLDEITDLLGRLAQGESLLVQRVRDMRTDLATSTPSPSPRGAQPELASRLIDIGIVPTLRLVEDARPFVANRASDVGDAAIKGGGPMRQAKRDYDFFTELDDKLARLPRKPRSSPDAD